ncbi:glycoside hydrolase family 71/99-like protein [Cytophaga sp. FL35]|uniref:glycoside hydrolase family 71/99-like protein n=1 Tax=Cytophaga sp. FL35 TaxID=1904456 RepID=UPI00165388EE|nr:glycoside hydrolase family 71/99-like protein [Cytophaga sp. FL35]MBC7000393.1 hypothetical protein [Cytophaga sp. FL35]
MKLITRNSVLLLWNALLIAMTSCEKDSLTEETSINEKLEPVETTFSNEIKSNSAYYQLPPLEGNFSKKELQKIVDEELSNFKKGTISDKNPPPMWVGKNNSKKVYVHYMPWFQSISYDGYWGQHWTMANKNPNVTDEDGRRNIASHYYPLVGPYSSRDPYLQEYHFLLMKLAGIDGVIFDWYGSRNENDYGLIREATETFMEELNDIDLDFAIMYEDRVADNSFQNLSKGEVELLQDDMNLLNESYFVKDNYIRVQDKPAFFVFGPNYLTEESTWSTALENLSLKSNISFLSLWGSTERLPNVIDGEFIWISPGYMDDMEGYYNYGPNLKYTVGSAYPGYDNFYTEGGWNWGSDYFTIAPSIETFRETLFLNHHEDSEFVQLITWNDFGEGTMIEPTLEFGFDYLIEIQDYTKVHSNLKDLELATHLYLARQKFKDNPEVMSLLDQSYKYFKKLNVSRVKGILIAIDKLY